ncbi:mutagenesis and repair protein MucA [Enterobacter cloacae]|uniref:Mutagenesis and repair protein MucA n=1 Tax=Enterobacter cloacae TaxID=550 RepID=A0A377LPT5_ENTCL|nr:mutagenesis and repair protein MucA [Enterobacter cloacae]
MKHISLVQPDIQRVSSKQPFFGDLIPCGFPLPSEGIEDQPLDLHNYWCKAPFKHLPSFDAMAFL